MLPTFLVTLYRGHAGLLWGRRHNCTEAVIAATTQVNWERVHIGEANGGLGGALPWLPVTLRVALISTFPQEAVLSPPYSRCRQEQGAQRLPFGPLYCSTSHSCTSTSPSVPWRATRSMPVTVQQPRLDSELHLFSFSLHTPPVIDGVGDDTYRFETLCPTVLNMSESSLFPRVCHL